MIALKFAVAVFFGIVTAVAFIGMGAVMLPFVVAEFFNPENQNQ